MLKLNRSDIAGTEFATFYLFHPKDLEHRSKDEAGWEDKNCSKEFAAGSLIVFETGGDGMCAFRFTDGKLSDREKKYHVCKWSFRYVVRHKCVYLDGGFNFPHEGQSDEEPDCRIRVPNGNYKVTIHAIRWYDEPDAQDANGHPRKGALPDYVIRFERVKNINAIRSAASPVMIFKDKGWKAKPRKCAKAKPRKSAKAKAAKPQKKSKK